MNEGRPGEPGNFGDEITKTIIENVFSRRVVWSEFENCQIIGAGSIIEEVTNNKQGNRPFLWGSGFIQEGSLTITPEDYKILAVRGKHSLGRITNPPEAITLGDPGLLASFLLRKKPETRYQLGILPHYVDMGHPFVIALSKQTGVRIIDPTLPATQVVKEIAECETVISSSMHGLIVSDSLDVPNVRLKMSDKLKGGLYKFNDYYSVFSEPRYRQVTPNDLTDLTPVQLCDYVKRTYVPVPKDEMDAIKQRLMRVFPF